MNINELNLDDVAQETYKLAFKFTKNLKSKSIDTALAHNRLLSVESDVYGRLEDYSMSIYINAISNILKSDNALPLELKREIVEDLNSNYFFDFKSKEFLQSLSPLVKDLFESEDIDKTGNFYKVFQSHRAAPHILRAMFEMGKILPNPQSDKSEYASLMEIVSLSGLDKDKFKVICEKIRIFAPEFIEKAMHHMVDKSSEKITTKANNTMKSLMDNAYDNTTEISIGSRSIESKRSQSSNDLFRNKKW